MESSSTRRVGRPKATPQTGPLVLEGGRDRIKIGIEIAADAADEVKEYARWVELSTTVEYALREVFRRDRLWQQNGRTVARIEPPTPAQGLPPQQTHAPTLPPATLSARTVPTPAPQRPPTTADSPASAGGVNGASASGTPAGTRAKDEQL
jgi:hypothetical protein